MLTDASVEAPPQPFPIDGRRDRCRICFEPDPQVVELREMLFGTRERFDYLHCRACGALQIRDVPGDLGRHYPPEYYDAAGEIPPAGFSDDAIARYRSSVEELNRDGRAGRAAFYLRQSPVEVRREEAR